MHSNESDGIAAFLTEAVSDGTSSSWVAEAVASAFQGIDQALAPIIGTRGVAALYKRTVHLAGGTHSWLAAMKEGVPTAMDVALLKAALEEQTAADAAAAGLAAAFLAEGARAGETGVIAAFEQHPNRSRSRIVADLIAGGQLGLVESRADLSIDEVVYMLIREIRRLKATRVVIDSLSSFELALAPTFREDFRASLSNLVTTLAGAGVTVLMTSELEDRYTDLRFSPYGTAFLTDAIIVQRYIEVDSRLRRVMAAVKVRASAHSDQLREYRIDAEGIHIGEMLTNEEGLLGGRPTKRTAPAARVGGPDGHG